MRGVPLAAFVVLAGCLNASDPTAPAPTTEAGAPTPSPVHRFQACDELDFYRSVPYSTNGLGSFRPLPADPAGQTMHLLYTAMACASANGTLAPATHVTAIFSLLNVQELKGHEVEGAVGYQLLRTMTTSNAELLRDWAPMGVQGANGPVVLQFTDQPNGPKARADLRAASPLHTVDAQSTMTGAPAAGRAGVLGLYTLNGTTPLAHRVEFSDYSNYARGAAVLRPGLMGAPANAVQAYHNLGFGVSFLLAKSGDVAPPQGI